MEEVTSDDDVYEVESIIDSVVAGGRMYYKVRWKNYGKDGDTWEPKENLLSCEDLLNNYNRMQAEKTSGLSLPGDVFTAADSESDRDKHLEDHEELKDKKFKKKSVGRPKKNKTEQTKVKKPRKVVKSSSSSSDSDSEGPPPLKDNFWEKLQEGKIDVFATDLYSKVKSRRPPEKETDTKVNMPPEILGKSKKSITKKKPEKTDARPTTSDDKIMKQPKEKKSSSDKHKGNKEDSTKSKNKVKKEEKIRRLSVDSEASSTIDADEKNGSPHVVLQYLEGEIKTKSHGKTKSGRRPGRPPKESKVKEASTDIAMETDEKESTPQPGIVNEKLDVADSSASEQKDMDVNGNDSTENCLTEKSENNATTEKKSHQSVEMNQDEMKDQKLLLSESTSESKIDHSSENQKQDKTVESTKPCGVFEAIDAFSAHLRQSDLATSERMIQRKVKAKKSKVPRTTPVTEKPTSPSEKVEETEKMLEGTLTSPSAPAENEIKGLQTESAEISSTSGDPQKECIPEMSEFLKIQVTFNLDEVTLKEIERHHEIGEPHCRLDKDITNAEFRQHIRSNNFEIVYEALKSKTMMYNLEHTDSVWMTQLMVAAAAGYDEIVKILSHHGAKVNARTKNGNTALMFAAEKGHDIVCRILIVYGAYVNLQTTSGETALMKAAKNGYTMIVRYLLQAGADPIVKSVHGTTALELAERSGHSLLSSLIKDHETNITAHVNECIQRECHSLGVKTIGLPILAPRSYNIRESPLIHVAFNSVLHNVPPNQGLILFAVHGMIMSGLSIKCRMRGPCHVMAVTMNNFVMEPLMPGKSGSEENTHYMTNLIWKTGQNSVKLFISQDPLSSEKVFVSVFQCGLVA